MNDFGALLDELALQDRRRSGGGGSRSDNAVQHRQAPAVRPEVYFRQPTPDRHFAKAMGTALADISATNAATARAMLVDQAANLADRQRALVTRGRELLLKAASDGTMTALQVAEGEGLLHHFVARNGL